MSSIILLIYEMLCCNNNKGVRNVGLVNKFRKRFRYSKSDPAILVTLLLGKGNVNSHTKYLHFTIVDLKLN